MYKKFCCIVFSYSFICKNYLFSPFFFLWACWNSVVSCSIFVSEFVHHIDEGLLKSQSNLNFHFPMAEDVENYFKCFSSSYISSFNYSLLFSMIKFYFYTVLFVVLIFTFTCLFFAYSWYILLIRWSDVQLVKIFCFVFTIF